jgi:hypothetical protein
MSEENPDTNASAEATERVGFCQDCGKPLSRETIRSVGRGIFCEPCLARRIGSPLAEPAQPPPAADPKQPAAGWGPVWHAPAAGTTPPAGYGAPSAPPQPHLPNPTLAAIFGVIPGVGAMYNGQLVKGLLHLGIFAVLVTMENNVSGVFGLFVAVWEIYQIFDAYHTARARRDGMPLPDPLGLNDLASRLGPTQGWTAQAPAGTAAPYGGTPPVPPAGTGFPPAGPEAAYAPEPPAAPYAAVAGGYAPGYAAHPVPPANWAGYVHPSTFAASSPPPPPGYVPVAPYAAAPPQPSAAAMAEEIRQQAVRDGATGTSYATAGTSYAAAATSYAASAGAGAYPARRFPVGAIALIALGALLLGVDLSAGWHAGGNWMMAGLFVVLAGWTLMRRLEWFGGMDALRDGRGPQLVCSLRAPVMFLALAVLFALEAANVATFGQSWPVLPIVLGTVMVLERTVGARAAAAIPMAAPVGYGPGSVYPGVGTYPVAATYPATGPVPGPAAGAVETAAPTTPADVQP